MPYDYDTEIPNWLHAPEQEGRHSNAGNGEDRHSTAEDIAVPPLVATPWKWSEPSQIPPRRWLLGTMLVRNFITLLVAAGAVGKTSLAITAALSCVTGKKLLNEHVFEWSYNVWFLSLEDDEVEIRRRITASMMHHDLHHSDIEGRLFVNTGRQRKLVVAAQAERNGQDFLPRPHRPDRAGQSE